MTNTPFLALVTPLAGGTPPYPDQGLPGQQPRPDQGLPGQPNYPSQGPGFPTHPIAPGGQPPYPSTGPGFPTNPIAPGGQPPYPSTGPGFPTHPIAPGGQPPYPDQGLPPFISQPIELPPNLPEETPDGRPIDWKTAWTPQTGWIVVGIPTGPTVTPSRGREQE